MPITTLTEPCWRHVDSDGDDHPDESSNAHSETEEEAFEWLRVCGYDPPFRVAAYKTPCVVVSRDCCDLPVEDQDSGSGVHFPDEDTARSMASAYDLSIDGDRVVCGPDVECNSPESAMDRRETADA